MKKIAIFLNAFYAIIFTLFFLDAFSIVEIKNQVLKNGVYFCFWSGAIFLMFLNLFFFRKEFWYFLLPSFSVLSFFYADPLSIHFASGAWHTQAIFYENRFDENHKIEYQMRSTLAWKNRTVEVKYYSPFFMITKKVDWKKVDTVNWKKVNKEINEMGLKGG